MQASPSSTGPVRGTAGAGTPPYPAGGYRRRSLQSGSSPVVISPVLSAPNSVPATPQHGSRLPPGATILPSAVLPAQLQATATNPEHIPRKFLAAQAYYKLQQQIDGGSSAVSEDDQGTIVVDTTGGVRVELATKVYDDVCVPPKRVPPLTDPVPYLDENSLPCSEFDVSFG